MKKSIAFLLLLHFVARVSAQSNGVRFNIRVPVQFEQQKANVSTSFGAKEVRGNAVNFGADALLGYTVKKVELYAGMGYFRNRVNIRREYDHRALNPGIDSIPLGTEALNYTYSLFRIPTGLSYIVTRKGNTDLRIAIEHFFNFSFRRKYNGAIPFSGSKNTNSSFAYFGNSTNLLINLKFQQTEIGAFLRVFNSYKKNKYLKENENEAVTRYIDAFGINLKYSFNL